MRTFATLTLATALLAAASTARADYIKLQANTAKCIHKKDANWNNGNPIHLWDCSAGGAENKSWYLDTSTGYIRSSENTAKCLHLKYDNSNNGNPIQVWDCSAGPGSHKQWSYDSSTGQIRLQANTAKCIHKKNADDSNGNPIHLWDCSAGSNTNKSWSLTTSSIDTSISSQCTGSNAASAQVLYDDANFGNSTAGGSYYAIAGIIDRTYAQSNLSSADWIQAYGSLGSDFVWAGGRAEASAKLFGESESVLALEASVSENNDDADSTILVEIMGLTVLDDTIDASYEWSEEFTFFEAEMTYAIFTVSGEVVGTVGFDASAEVAGLGLTLSATPYADVTVDARAGTGVWCAGAGVGGELTLIGVSVPIEGTLVYADGDIAWTVDADLTFQTVDGALYLYAEYCFDEETVTLVSWNGYSDTFNLFSDQGCL